MIEAPTAIVCSECGGPTEIVCRRCREGMCVGCIREHPFKWNAFWFPVEVCRGVFFAGLNRTAAGPEGRPFTFRVMCPEAPEGAIIAGVCA